MTDSYKLGITLSQNIEVLFDQGTIAIVPMPGPMHTPTEWRCVVLDESKKEDTIMPYMKLKASIAQARVEYYTNDTIGD